MSASVSVTTIWPMYRTLVGLGMACALCIVSVFILTAPAIEQNQKAALQNAIFNVLPGTETTGAFEYSESAGFIQVGEASGDNAVYAGFDPQGRLVGVALSTQGQGYQDKIRILYGYSPSRQAIVGMQVLESRETPGLGDKIETDAAFLENFIELDVSLNAAGTDLNNAIAMVKSGQKNQAWQIDGITGATISSQAITDMLDVSARHWLPRIVANLDSFSTTMEASDE